MSSYTYTCHPIVVLIFDNRGVIQYKAYSPNLYRSIGDNTSLCENIDDAAEELGRLLARVYNRVMYDNHNPLNNETMHGNLKEVHTRFIDVPLSSRKNKAFIKVYNNKFCNYKPVHHKSPIVFNESDVTHTEEDELYTIECIHEVV